MISSEIFNFLTNLKENNNRDWFHANKPLYTKLREQFQHIVELMIHEVSQFDNTVAGLTPKDCIFRINRDIRFSNDKSPYKTNFGAFVVPGGRKAPNPGYYLHLEPGTSFLACGIYMPPSSELKNVRTEIYDNIEEFKEIIGAPEFIHHFQELWGEKLKMAPKGFPKDFADIELLKYKHYIVDKAYTDEQITAPDFLDELRAVYKAAYPLNRFIYQALIQN